MAGFPKFTFADLFSGIGGFHLAMHRIGGECVFASEWDEHARKTYEVNFRDKSPRLFDRHFVGDITKVNIKDIPSFDILCAGFPCQPFSQAGCKRGFGEVRGTLFFNIAKILKEKMPRAFFLENVHHFLHHDQGKTFEVVRKILEKDLGYSFFYKVIRASEFGLPQHRPRLFIVGFREKVSFVFPDNKPLQMTMSDVFQGRCNKKIGYTLRVGGRGSGLGDRRNWDSYTVDGSIVRLQSEHALMMQGFPKDFIFPVSERQAMKQLGNSVAVPVVQAIGEKILEVLF